MGAFVIAGLIIGAIVGMAVQRFRTACQGLRAALSAVPKARATVTATGREAFIWVAATIIVVLAVARGGR